MARCPVSRDDARPYMPPQSTGGRCPHCGASVLVREYRDGAYVEIPRPLTFVLGREHECQGRKDGSV